MKNAICLSFLILLLLVTQGCATHGTSNIQLISDTSDITVVSFFENNLYFYSQGTTIFQAWDDHVDTEGWEINKEANEIAKKLIQTRGRFKHIKMVHYLNGSPGDLQLIKKNVSSRYVIVIKPQTKPDPFYGTYAEVSNYGLMQRAFLGIHSRISYVIGQIDVIDVQNEKVIAYSPLSGFDKTLNATWLEKSDFPEAVTTPAAKRQVLLAIEKGIAETFEDLKIITKK